MNTHVNSPLKRYQLYIDGAWCDGSAGKALTTINPASGLPWAEFYSANAQDTDRAVTSAKRALNDSAWRDMSASARGGLLYKLADLVERDAEILGSLETTDSGKLSAETASQTAYVAQYYRYFAGLADKLEGSVLPIDKPNMHVFTKRVPIGVVAAIVPWNAQMFLTATKLGPALAAGCTVVLKASEVAPIPMLEFARLIDEAGFPPGVVSVITGDAEECSIPLTRHRDVDRIAFTGGVNAGQSVVRNSAENFALTTLELGGKSPIIVFEDADLETAVNGIIAGNFGASGQSCVAGSRVLVQRSILDQVIEKIESASCNLIVGDPHNPQTHVGPLCTTTQVENIERTLKQAVAQGATIRFGGERPAGLNGNYFCPTLVLCPHHNVASLEVEMFGPVMSVLAFDTEQEAIDLANDCPFGLGSGIFTRDLTRAYRVSDHIRAGICWINTYRVISPIAPFGGFNHSGYGREAGRESILDYTRTRTTWVNMSSQPMANPFVMR